MRNTFTHNILTFFLSLVLTITLGCGTEVGNGRSPTGPDVSKDQPTSPQQEAGDTRNESAKNPPTAEKSSQFLSDASYQFLVSDCALPLTTMLSSSLSQGYTNLVLINSSTSTEDFSITYSEGSSIWQIATNGV